MDERRKKEVSRRPKQRRSASPGKAIKRAKSGSILEPRGVVKRLPPMLVVGKTEMLGVEHKTEKPFLSRRIKKEGEPSRHTTGPKLLPMMNLAGNSTQSNLANYSQKSSIGLLGSNSGVSKSTFKVNSQAKPLPFKTSTVVKQTSISQAQPQQGSSKSSAIYFVMSLMT